MRVVLVLLACCLTPALADEPAYRAVPIPAEEHGYSRLQSQVVQSAAELAALLAQAEQRNAWNNPAAFKQAIAAAKLDFEREALVLLFDATRSGAEGLVWQKPVLADGVLTCAVKRTNSDAPGADVMGYRGWALRVRRDRVKAVIWGGKRLAVAVPYRRLALKQRAGWRTLKPQVIASAEQHAALLKRLKSQVMAEALKPLAEAKVDWAKQCLVLLTHTVNSGSIPVSLTIGQLTKSGALPCRVKIGPSPALGTADMAYHAWALVVERAAVRTVRHGVMGQHSLTIPEPRK